MITRERRWQKRWERIKSSKFNKWYGRVKGEGVLEYLKKGWKEERWQRVAKLRLGDGISGGTGKERRERSVE